MGNTDELKETLLEKIAVDATKLAMLYGMDGIDPDSVWPMLRVNIEEAMIEELEKFAKLSLMEKMAYMMR